MPAAISLKQLLGQSEQIVMCPEIYDCTSAKCVELCGFQAVLLSSAELSMSLLGNPDMGLITLDDVVGATERIAAFSSLSRGLGDVYKRQVRNPDYRCGQHGGGASIGGCHEAFQGRSCRAEGHGVYADCPL